MDDEHLTSLFPRRHHEHYPVSEADAEELMSRVRAVGGPVRLFAYELLDESLPALLRGLQSCRNVRLLMLRPAVGAKDAEGWSDLLVGIAGLGPELLEVAIVCLTRVPGALGCARVREALSTTSVGQWDVGRATPEDGAAVLEAMADNSRVQHLALWTDGGSPLVWPAAVGLAGGDAGPARLHLSMQADAESDAAGLAALVAGVRPRSSRRFRLEIFPLKLRCDDPAVSSSMVRALRSSGWPAWVGVAGLRVSGLPDVERELIADIRSDAIEGLHMEAWQVSRAVVDALAEALPGMTRLRELSLDSVFTAPKCDVLSVMVDTLRGLSDRRLELRLCALAAVTDDGYDDAEPHVMQHLTGLLESEHHRALRIRVNEGLTAHDLREARGAEGGAPWQDVLARRLELQDAWDGRWRRRRGVVSWRAAWEG